MTHILYVYESFCLACIVDALSKLWEHCSQKKRCVSTARGIEKLQDEVTNLKEQLVAEQTALRSRDTELASLRETVSEEDGTCSLSLFKRRCMYMCTYLHQHCKTGAPL